MRDLSECSITLETSTLINFLKLQRLDLMLCVSTRWTVTDVVREEISFRCQYDALAEAIKQRGIRVVRLTEMSDLRDFAVLTASGMGRGEASSIIEARRSNSKLAVDDLLAIRKAKAHYPQCDIIRSPDILLYAVAKHILDEDEANRILTEWAQSHRFIIKASSLQEWRDKPR